MTGCAEVQELYSDALSFTMFFSHWWADHLRGIEVVSNGQSDIGWDMWNRGL
jgi:hypothetical protein